MIAQQNKYLETKIQTATQEQLLIMLYDGAIRFCKISIEGIQQNNFAKAHENLMKAQDIIAEFVITLRQDSAVAEPLLRLYEYFIHRLTEANLKKETGPIEEVLKYLQDLKETWIQAALELKKQAQAPASTLQHG